MAIDAALSDLENVEPGAIPTYIRDQNNVIEKTGETYKFPHDYPNHWVKQNYLPENLVGTKYYKYGENKYEQSIKAYWDAIKKD